MSNAKIGFELQKQRLSLQAILPIRQIKDAQLTGTRFRTILTSLKEVGLVEPLVVFPVKGTTGKYLLLDGHFRYHALKKLEHTHVDCVVSTDDEGFTYNARVNRLNPIQEHKMIVKAIENGVRPEKIAAALNLPVKLVRSRIALLDGVHEEAENLLRDKGIAAGALRLFRKVNGIRQIEIAELMVAAGNYSTAYAEALILGTPREQLVNPAEEKQKEGLTTKDIARMEEEMNSLEGDFKAVEESYGENMLTLTLIRGFLKRLLENGKVVRFLNANHGDILAEFESIVATEVL